MGVRGRSIRRDADPVEAFYIFDYRFVVESEPTGVAEFVKISQVAAT